MFKALLSSTCLIFSGIAIAQQPEPASVAGWFTRVNGIEISTASFDREAQEAFRTKFYHGTPPEAEVNYMLRQVGEVIIDRLLLQREIETRKIEADAEEVKVEIDKLEKRYAGNPSWMEQREQALPSLKIHFEVLSRQGQLERLIRNVKVSAEEVRAYYDKNPKLFTEPGKNKLSLILFRIDPSAPGSEWEKTLKRAEDTKAEILAGADFAKLALARSNDHSAENGGDLGYLHQGMLAPSIEAELDAVKPGGIGGPTRTLEGYVVYRLDGRIPAELRDFASVEKRASELLLREKSDQTWLDFLDSLRKSASIEISPAFETIMKTPKPVGSSRF